MTVIVAIYVTIVFLVFVLLRSWTKTERLPSNAEAGEMNLGCSCMSILFGLSVLVIGAALIFSVSVSL